MDNIPYGHCRCGCGQKTSLSPVNDAWKGYAKGEPRRYIHGHRSPRRNVAEYTVEERGYKTPCWIWRRGQGHGYGKFWNGTKHVAAHRLYYERHVGPIPRGLEIDHLCRVTLCVNPDHLEPVTSAENVRRSARSKLTAADAQQIRALFIDGVSQAELARRFGIAASGVHRIVRGQTWK